MPRALHRRWALDRLITEMWVKRWSVLGSMGPARVRGRYHPDLAGATVKSWNYRSVAYEVAGKLRRSKAWARTMKGNAWFQRRAVRRLERVRDDEPRTVFAYSYAALGILEYARKRGWRTVLGQIDPGVVEERLMAELQQRHEGYAPGWAPSPPEYWDAWRRECALADRIVVNSAWSRDALVAEGVPTDKIAIVPLSYEPPAAARGFVREYPTRFTETRPLRVLFLGQLILRKGIAETLEAAALLEKEPVEFWLVGPQPSKLPARWRKHPRIKWIGSVARNKAADYYRRADVFLFPTHSDGFGMTQLEAQAWKLPIIASRNAGEVVRDGENGVLLPRVTSLAIAEAIREALGNPLRLAGFSEQSVGAEQFGLDRLANSLTSLFNDR